MADRARPYIVVVSGTRRGLGEHENKLYTRLNYHASTARQLNMELIVVHGANPGGADRLADDWATENGYWLFRTPAPWKRGGGSETDRSAGPDRNEFMIDKAMVLAEDEMVHFEGFPDAQSIGTRGAIKYAKQFPDEILVHVTEIRA